MTFMRFSIFPLVDSLFFFPFICLTTTYKRDLLAIVIDSDSKWFLLQCDPVLCHGFCVLCTSYCCPGDIWPHIAVPSWN